MCETGTTPIKEKGKRGMYRRLKQRNSLKSGEIVNGNKHGELTFSITVRLLSCVMYPIKNILIEKIGRRGSL
jgi:hypothetical protein